MKLVSYRVDGAWRAGAVHDAEVIDVAAAMFLAGWIDVPSALDVRTLLDLYGNDLASVGRSIELIEVPKRARVGRLSDLVIGPPVPNPAKVFCIGLNYSEHVAETGRALPEHPDVFAKFASTLIGHKTPIAGTDVTAQLDFEGELAVVIGRATRRVGPAEALEHVAGVSVLNDITARDLQYRGTQWLMGKAVDRSSPFGPALITLDEIPDVQMLDITTRVNGSVMQQSNTRHMIFSVADIVSYLSQSITLSPGDVIATGTPDGIGSKRNPPVWLRSGDLVEVELEGVGTLTNLVA